MANYISVTPINRKEAIIIGRTLYVIERSGHLINYCGYITIRPRLVKCRLQVSNHPHMKDHQVYIPDDETPEDYKGGFGPLLDKLIEEKKLFIKLKDPITKYTRV